MMDFHAIEKWSNLVDELEDQLLDRELEIPDFQGDTWVDPMGRTWRRAPIGYGKVGGRWCYWSQDHTYLVVDSIFNGNSPFFAGMLRMPYDGHVQEGLLIEAVGEIKAAESPAQENAEVLRRADAPLPRSG